MNRISASKGFTLVELIISFSIMLLVLSLVMVSTFVMINSWNRVSSKEDVAWLEAKSIFIVNNSLQSILPFQVTGNNSELGYYFLGREDGFTGVTNFGFKHSAAEVVFRLIKEKEKDGSFSLYYEEADMSSTNLVSASQILDFDFRIQVLRGLSNLSFEYYGWNSIAEYNKRNDLSGTNVISTPTWHSSYDGLVLKLHPLRIKITTDSYNWIIDVPDRTDFLRKRENAGDDT